MGKILYNNPILKERRRELRHYPTKAEVLLWQRLNKRQLDDYRFFRQYSAGPYILDFYCPKLRLAVEVDGARHAQEEDKAYDEERTSYLQTLNITTVRFWNQEVIERMDSVVAKIRLLFPPFTKGG